MCAPLCLSSLCFLRAHRGPQWQADAPALVAPSSVGRKAQFSRKLAVGLATLALGLCAVVVSTASGPRSILSHTHFHTVVLTMLALGLYAIVFCTSEDDGIQAQCKHC